MGETRSSMAAVVRAGRFGLCRNWKYQNAGAMFGRTLTTSKKNEETATINEKIASHTISDEAIASAAQKKWASYGFSSKDQHEDVATADLLTFASITLVFVGGYVLYTYGPDRTYVFSTFLLPTIPNFLYLHYSLKDWAQREAYLALRHRDAAGLPLINKDYVDVAAISLPSEEELGDTEIII